MAVAWPACTQGALAGGRGDNSRGRAQGARGPEAQPGVPSSPACGGRAEGCSLVEAGFVLAFHQVFCTELAEPACRLGWPFVSRPPCKGAALDTRLLPMTALSAHSLCGLRGASRPGWGSILRTLGPPHLSTSGLQRRMAVSTCVMGAWVAPNSCQVSCLMLSGHN